MIFENETVDHNRYINEVLLVALKYGNSIFENDWTFQQDGAKSHFHENTAMVRQQFSLVHSEGSLAFKQS